MAKYLDSTGVSTLWSKIKGTFLTPGGGDGRYSYIPNSPRDFTAGTRIDTDIWYNNTEGDSFYMVISGDTYFSLGSIFTLVQGYIYDNTIIAYSVNNLGMTKIDHLYAININGYLTFWFSRLGYWQSYKVEIYRSSAGDYRKNHAISVVNSEKPVGTKEIDLCGTKYTNAYISDLTWGNIGSKPETSTRWPRWSEVTDKPSTFTPSDHSHEYIYPTRYDSDAPSPKTKGNSLTFQFSYFDSDWWNVLNMRSYGDYNYLSSQILTPAGNPGSDVGYGDMYWREGRQSTWIAKRKVLDDVNSSVSGGGNSLGSSLTVKIGGTEKTLTIPSTIAWSSLTSVPSTFTPSSHEHSRLKSGYGVSDHLDQHLLFAYRISESTSGTPATTDNSNAVLTINRHDGHYDSQIGFGSDGRIKYRSYSAQAISDNVTKAWNTLAYTSEIPTTMAWSNITSKPDSYTPSSHTHTIIYERSDARDQNPTPSEAALVCGRGFYMDFVRDGGPSDQGTYSAGFFINPWNGGGNDWSGGGIHELRFNQNGKIYHRVGDGSGWGSWETLITTSFALTNSEIDTIIT